MGKATFQLENGKRVTLGVPDGTTPEEASAMFEDFLSTPEGKAASEAKQTPNEPGLLDKLGTSTGVVGRGLLEGAINTAGIFSNPLASLINQGLYGVNKLAGGNVVPYIGNSQQAAEWLANKAGLPQATSEEGQLVQAAARGMGGGAAGLGIGGAVGATSALGKFLTTAPLAQLGAGATSGAASEAARQTGAGPGGQIAAGLLAGAVTPMAARGITNAAMGAGERVKNAIQGNYATPEMQSALEAGKRFNVPVLASDISQNPTVQRLGTMAEKVPGVGLIGPRIAQHDAAKQAAEKLVKELPGAKFGESWTDVVKQGQINRLESVKTSIGKMYDRATALAGDTPITASNTVNKIDELLAKESAQVKPNGSIINWLTAVKAGLVGEPVSSFQAMKGQLTPKAPASFPVFRNLQDDIQEQIRGYYNNSDKAVIAARDIIPMQQLKKAMDADLKAGLPQEAYTAWNNADKMYAKYLTPYKSGVAKISTAQDPVELFKAISTSSSTKPSILYATLDRNGKDAMMYGMSKSALDKAIDPKHGTFSPQRFHTAIKEQLSAISVHPDKAQSEQITAFSKLMGSIPRAGQFRENPPTGNRSLFEAASVGGAGATVGLMTGGVSGVPAGAAAAAVGTGGLSLMTRMLFTTDAGKRLLLAAKSVPEKSPAMERLAAQAIAMANAQYAQQQAAQQRPQ